MTVISLPRLSRDITAFLKFKRALGYAYRRPEQALRSFERFATRQVGPKGRSRINLESTIKDWLVEGRDRSALTVSLYLGIVRQLCLYRRRRDPTGFVPEHALAPKTDSRFVPHIFSREEIHRLLEAAGQPRRYNAKIQSITVRTMMLILYCTGLRFGEAARLSISDVDLTQRLFTIRESKGRTRIVPFGADLAQEIERYLIERERCVGSSAADTSRFFVDRRGRPANMKALSWIFTKLLREEGLKPAKGRAGARPYDFRHAFAVHRLTDWYRKKYDVHARLPLLSAYMGHLNVLGTEVYLHATPELLRLASQRFASRLQSARRIE